MREFSTPLTIEVPSTGNLTDDVVANAREAGSTVVFARPGPDGLQDVTAADFLREVSAVAKGLMAAGIERGDRVALISKTRYEWTLLDYAIWFAGAVTVPVYETSSAEQIAWILQDSGARAVVAEGPDHVARVHEARGGLPALNHVWSLADDAVDVLTRLGADIGDDQLEERRTVATPLDLATLIEHPQFTHRSVGAGRDDALGVARRLGHEDLGPRVFDDPGDLLRRRRLVHRHGHRTGEPDRVVEERPLVPGPGDEGDAVAGFEAGGDQSLRDLSYLGQELRGGDVLPLLRARRPAREHHGVRGLRRVADHVVGEVARRRHADRQGSGELTQGATSDSGADPRARLPPGRAEPIG